MEWRPTGWSLCLPLLIFPCTINSRSSLLAPAHSDGPEKNVMTSQVSLYEPTLNRHYWVTAMTDKQIFTNINSSTEFKNIVDYRARLASHHGL